MQDADRGRTAVPPRESPSPEPIKVIVVDKVLKASGVGAFLIILAAAFYFGRDFLLPVSLAFLFGLVLSPVVRALARRGIAEWATAILLVLALSTAIASALYFLSGPVSQWIDDAPRIGRQVQSKIAVLRRPVDAVADASKEVEELTEADDPRAQRVVLSEPGLLSRAASGAPEVAAQVAVTLILLLFLLASGDMFYEKLVKSLPTLSDKKRGLRIARAVEREVSRYLFTISLINVGLGAAVAAGMFVIGMPNPVLWGLLAALLNFIPYFGALLGTVLVALVGLVSFDTIGMALLAPLIYLACTTLEGQIVTPLIIGRRLEMNPVAIFLTIAFWGWLWGIVGALIAVPLLVIVKVFADHVEGLAALGEFLAARNAPPLAEDEENGPTHSS
jgi:predicted PurR-regulated permease PerM